MWILFAVALNAVEFFIPRIPFFPWLKPGIANCVIIFWIIEFGVVDALLFSLLRIWIAGFYFGFSFLTMTLGLSGAVCSTLVMGAAWTLLGKRGIMGTIGIGVCGALTHNITQIIVVYFLLAHNAHLFYQVPVMMAASVGFGAFTGALAPLLLSMHQENSRRILHPTGPIVFADTAVTRRDAALPLALLALGCAIVFINSTAVLAAVAFIATVFAARVRGGSTAMALRPLTKFWLLFLFVGCIDLFDTYGTKIEGLSFLTVEGVRGASLQWLRLWTWVELASLLTLFKFHTVALHSMRKLFPNHRSTIYAGILSLEYFPAIIRAVQLTIKGRILQIALHPVISFRKGIELVYEEVAALMNASNYF